LPLKLIRAKIASLFTAGLLARIGFACYAGFLRVEIP
jgi:hypothetical protein